MDSSLNALFQALADPTRRQILQLLNEGDKSAGELAAQFNMSAPSVSHHLNVLKTANLVSTTRNGQNIIYTLNTSVAQEMVQLVMNLFNVGGEHKKD